LRTCKCDRRKSPEIISAILAAFTIVSLPSRRFRARRSHGAVRTEMQPSRRPLGATPNRDITLISWRPCGVPTQSSAFIYILLPPQIRLQRTRRQPPFCSLSNPSQIFRPQSEERPNAAAASTHMMERDSSQEVHPVVFQYQAGQISGSVSAGIDVDAI
jgi:hypothetical protein